MLRIPPALALFPLGCLSACHSTPEAFDTTSGTADARATQDDLRWITLDELYDPDKKVEFVARPAGGFVWLDETSYLWPRTDATTKKLEWLRVQADTGAATPYFDAATLAKMEAALAQLPGVDKARALRLVLGDVGVLNKARTAALLDVGQDLWSYTFGADSALRLTNSPETDEENAIWSPDGKHVSFVRGNDLYVVDVAPLAERRLTTDGSATVLNGKLDWLYQEEVYGRGNYNSHWWSPDSTRIAFLRLDEQGVPLYTLVDDVSEPIRVETTPYPRPGEPNPLVQLGWARADGSGTSWVDLTPWKDAAPLVVDVAWSPENVLHFSVQDREQTWLELCRAEPAGQATRLIRETTRAWVENNGSPTWLADRSFLWASERDGWRHLYHYQADGKLVRQVTKGEWEARTLHGVDEAAGWIYFSGTAAAAIGGDAFRIKLDGTGQERLTKGRGTHSAAFSPKFTRFVDTWSSIDTPAQVRLHAADGRELRVVDANPAPLLERYALSRPEFHQVPTRDGFLMEALLIKPLGFDPARRYPVFQWTYAGPHSPQVADRWSRDFLWFQFLAQRGIAVWVCDNRSASGKGAVSAWSCYQKLGATELADIEDGLDWLTKQGWVDESRIGIAGWSYGGFMTSYALTHSKRFALGIAGGSVTSWKDYDSIYTERFMRTPQNNPEGYAQSSVVAAAKELSGALLLIHGQIDDNVHPGNTLRLADALMRANLPFELQLYPRSRHGVSDGRLVAHWRTTMWRFIERHLLANGQG